MTQHYDPNQPRVPVGHHDGGQWTGGGSSPSIAKRIAPERNGLLDAILGPHSGDGRDAAVQLAFLREPSPRQQPPSIPTQRPPFKPIVPGGGIPGLALNLFALLSQLDSDEQRAILSFRAREYRRGSPDPAFRFEAVQLLNQSEVDAICSRFEDVQKFTDTAVKAFRNKAEAERWSPAQFGTAVHKVVADDISAEKNVNFLPEVSFVKMKADGVEPPARPVGMTADQQYQEMLKPGAKGSIRIDAYELQKEEQTVCIYDIKTGESGLRSKRFAEIFTRVAGTYQWATRIVITEVRPQDPWRPARKPTLQGE